MKLTITSLFLAGALIVGALYYTNPKQSELKDNVSNIMAETVTAATFLAKNIDEERIVIDVRTPEEYATGHMPNSKNINFYSANFMQEINTLDKDKKYSVYCRSGNRSGQALALMESLGFENVIDLDGGIVAWAQIGQELCTNC